MDTALDFVSQIVGHRLQQEDIRRILGALGARDREEFMGKMADILAKLASLLEVSNRVSHIRSLDALLQCLIDTTTEAVNAERGTLFLHDADTGELYASVGQDDIKEIRMPRHLGIAGAVFTSGQAAIVPDAYADPRFHRDIDHQTGYRTRNLVCVPIQTGTHEIIGVIEVLNKKAGDFTAGDLTLLQAITAQTSAALQNARLFEHMQSAREEQRQLLEMTTAISTELHLQSLLAKIMETTTTMLNADRSTLFVYDAKTNDLWSQVAQGEDVSDIRFPSHLGIAGTVFTTGATINIPDAYADPRFNPAVDKQTGYHTRSILCMPVINKAGETIGVTQVLNKHGGPFTRFDEERLKAFSAQVSIALENAKLFEDVLNIKNYNESILESLSDGVITLDANKRITKCNSAALRILNTYGEKLLGTSANDYFSIHNNWILDILGRVIDTGKPDFVMDTRLLLYNGDQISVNLTIVPLINVKQEHIGSMLVFEDITSEKRIKSTFGRYLSKEVVDALLSSPDGLKLGGEMREVTFLVSDLRGFTSLASRLPPQDIIDILNRYLECMVDMIAHYGGTIDEFQGDGILAFFGAPLAASDDPERAIACAIAMQTALVRMNAEQSRRHLPELVMGIGINTGEAIVGNIGSEKRTKYGAVGSAINTAYRIESYTVGGQILISPSTYERVHSLVQVRGTQEVQFKGLAQPVTLYDITGLGGAYALALPPKAPEAFTRLEPPLPIACFAVQGKKVSDLAIAGSITRLAASAAEVSLAAAVTRHTNLKIILALQDAVGLSEVYAKVLAVDPPPPGSLHTKARLEFTSLPDDAKTFLERQRRTALQARHCHAP